MKLQFSLATLLVCVTISAVLCTILAAIPACDSIGLVPQSVALTQGSMNFEFFTHQSFNWHKATAAEIALRLAWAAPLSLAATLAILWAIRRLKSRREKGPPVG
jgi:hypothetical protein